MPETEPSGSTSGSGGLSHLPWNQVPHFRPGETDLTEWTKKVEFLAQLWPPEHLQHLAPRIALQCEGSAFQRISRLDPKVLRVNSVDGVKAVVEQLGGIWGKSNLESKFERFERAIYSTVQRSDETNESYLARHDHQFEELLSMKVAMDEFRAYILLRNSALSAEDKKRLIVESAGSLDYKTVVTNLKLLGSKSFQEVHAGKASSARSKTYEANAFVSHDAGSTELPSEDSAFHADDWNEEEWIEQLANDGDEDAALILDYEQSMLDTIQEDADLALSHTTYAEARKRLSDRFKNRGFWSSGPPKGKARGKGGEKGKKGFGGFRNSGNRKTLQQRILESTCRICGRKGHWKAECPERGRSSETGQTTLATAPTLVTLEDGVDALPLEFMSLPEEPIESTRDSSLTLSSFGFCFGVLGKHAGPNAINEGEIIESNREAIEKPGMSCMNAHHEFRSRKNAAHCAESFASTCLSTMPPEPAGSHFATYNSLGIIDTGATKTVIGSRLVASLIQSLSPEVRQQVTRCPCKVMFRFGNHGTLESKHALVVPIGSLRLKVAIVPGQTPFLLSNTLFRAIGATIDTRQGMLHSTMLERSIPININTKGLYVLDLNELAKPCTASMKPADTFHVSELKQIETCVSHPTSSQDKPQKSSGVQVSGSTGQVKQLIAKFDRPFAESCEHADHTGRGQFSHLRMPKSQRSDPCNPHPRHTLPQTHVESECHRSPGPVDQGTGGISDSVRGDLNGSISGADAGTARDLSDHVRKGPPWPKLCRHLGEGARVREVVPSHVPCLHEVRASALPPLCDSTGGTLRGDSAEPSSDSHVSSEEQGISKAEACTSANASDSSGLCRPQCRRELGTRGAGGRNSSSLCGCGRPAGSHDVPGDCSPGSDRPFAFLSTEWLDNFETREWSECLNTESCPNNIGENQANLHGKFDRLLQQFSKEANAVQQRCQTKSDAKHVHLIEVFCHANSELTKQVNDLGGRAIRMGLDQGDLKTPEGRETLFEIMFQQRPRNVWYSPTCSPWCAWNQFNEKRSMEMFDQIQRGREQHLFELALGIVLLRITRSQGNHMHWEQPRKSLMFKTPLVKELFRTTKEAHFDMCNVGALKCPETSRHIQKSMAVRTTSTEMFLALHGRTCRRDHEHRAIAGTVHVKGDRMSCSAYTERYTRKFSRYVAKNLIKIKQHMCVPVLVSHDDSRPDRSDAPCKRLRINSPSSSNPKSRMPPTPLEVLSGHLKRRRIDGKTTEGELAQSRKTELERLITVIKPRIPRVGKTEIKDPDLINQFQKIFPEKIIRRIMVCKGSDRTLAPPKDIVKNEAPYRIAAIVSRTDESVRVETDWEFWQELSNRQVVRPSHPARINITLFASNREPGKEGDQTESTRAERTVTGEDLPKPQHEVEDKTSGPTPSRVSANTPSQKIDLQSATHGSRFMCLSPEEKTFLIKLHQNLGHPSHARLSQVLREQGHEPSS